MKWQSVLAFALLVLGLGRTCLAAESPKFVVIHAGQLFDGTSDRLSGKQVIVIQSLRRMDLELQVGQDS